MTRSTLDSLCEIITDGAHKSPKEYPNGIPMMSVKDMTDKSFSYDNCKTISTEDAQELIAGGCRPKTGDVLIAKDGSVLKHVFTVRGPVDYVLLSSIAIIRPKKDKLIPEFLEYMFKNPQFKSMVLSSFLGGSGVPRIVLRDFKKVLIDIPTLEEQLAIAEVLSSLDDKIELLQKQNETLEALAQTLFRQWFIEEADDSWGKGTLNDIFEVIENGKRPKGGIKDIPIGIPSIGAENVKNIGIYDYTREKLVPEDFFNSMKKGIIEQGDILVYKDGGTPGNFIPKFSMVGCGFPHTVACINEHVFRCKPKPNLRSFAFGYLNSAYCKWELEERGTGAAIPGINSTQFKSVPVIIPKESILIDFESKVGPLYDKILTNSSNCRTLSDLRDTLLPKLMSGQVRVKLD